MRLRRKGSEFWDTGEESGSVQKDSEESPLGKGSIQSSAGDHDTNLEEEGDGGNQKERLWDKQGALLYWDCPAAIRIQQIVWSRGESWSYLNYSDG